MSSYSSADYQRIDWILDEVESTGRAVAHVPIHKMEKIMQALRMEGPDWVIGGAADSNDLQSARIEVSSPSK
jgi:hypothetical protein